MDANPAALKHIILALICGLCSAVFGFANSPKPPSKPDYSKEAAVIQSIRMDYTFNNDGTYSQDGTTRIKVQSAAGVQAYGVLVFNYAKDSEHPHIDYVRVRQPDGTVIVTPPSSYQDVTPQVTIYAPEYSDLREIHVPVKGLVPGSELEYRLHSHTFAPLVPGQFWLSYNFTNTAIVLDEELEVSVPEGRAVKVASASVQPAVTVKDGRKIYLWKTSYLKRVPQPLYPIGQAPPPDVLVSSFTSWAQVGKWWASLEDPQMAPTADIRAKAAELTQGLTTEQQKIQAIYQFVAQQFRYIGISFGVGRYRPHAADAVLGNGYGDCKDKHTLLASLLQAAGITAWPVLINSLQKIDPHVPSPGQFDHVITVVPEGKNLVWMDATSELAPLGLLTYSLRNKQALVIPRDQPAYLVATPAQPPVPNNLTFQADGQLAADGTFTGKMRQSYDGDSALLMRLVFNDIAQSRWKKAVQSISYSTGFGGTVSKVQVSSPTDTSHPFTISYNYVRKNYSNWSHNQIGPPCPPMLVPPIPHHESKTPRAVILGDPGGQTCLTTIELPKGYTPTLPKAVNLTAPFAEYHSTYDFKDGVLSSKRRLTIAADQVPAAQVSAYRKFRRAMEDDISTYIVLAAPGAASGAQLWTNPEFREAYQRALNDWRGGDFGAAENDIHRAMDAAPNSEAAWMVAGMFYSQLQHTDEAEEAYRKAIALAPQDLRPYKMLAWVLAVSDHEDEARQLWQECVKANPQSADAHGSLASILLYQKQYAQAAAEYETAIKLGANTWTNKLNLGAAYAGEGKTEQAVAAYKEAVKLNPTPLTWNNVGYDMADRKVDLPLAEKYLKMAVASAETASSKVSLDHVEDADLFHTDYLSAYWDSLGWLYYREGRFERAKRFINAAWVLSQDAGIGDHLGQVDEKLKDWKGAIQAFGATVQTSPPTPTQASGQMQPLPAYPYPSQADARKRLARLVGNSNVDVDSWQARGALSQTRTYAISRKGLALGQADFLVLIGSAGKAEAVKFVAGLDALRAAASRISSLHFNDPIPDDSQALILRRGILSCGKYSSTCAFVLLLPQDVRSVH